MPRPTINGVPVLTPQEITARVMALPSSDALELFIYVKEVEGDPFQFIVRTCAWLMSRETKAVN